MNTDDEPSPRQRNRPNLHAETTLVNPFLDLEHPDPAEELPDAELLNVPRTPAENLARNLGVELLTTQQAAMLSEVSPVVSSKLSSSPTHVPIRPRSPEMSKPP
jgi:hypothetical protein